jgi:hypothetical protein
MESPKRYINLFQVRKSAYAVIAAQTRILFSLLDFGHCRLAQVGQALGLQAASQAALLHCRRSNWRAESPLQRKALPHMYPQSLG